MIRAGSILIIFGVGSMVLHLTDYQFRLLSWAEGAQPWLGLILGVVGIALVAAGYSKANRNSAQPVVPAAFPSDQPYPAGAHSANQPYPAAAPPANPGYGTQPYPAAPGYLPATGPQHSQSPQQPGNRR